MSLNEQTLILVADDDPTNLAILSKSLGRAGYEVITAINGVEAVDVARLRLPDVILLDMMMPERNGVEACQMLKADPRTAPIPVLFVSSLSDTEELLRAFDAGGADYVNKPYRISEVLARVFAHAALRRAEQQLIRKNRQTEELARELAKANVRLAELSRSDPLTGILNRRAWEESARSEHSRYLRHGKTYGIMVIDVDQFKSFNDSQGHQAGDECLKRLAGSISSACRCLDIAGRYGGEEFVVLAPETGVSGSTKLAERIRKAIWSLNIPHPAGSVAERVTVSIGVTTGSTGSWDENLKRADDALYVAKKSGRNMVFSGGGSRMAVAPPVAPLESQESSHELTVLGEIKAKVLVVDDDPANRVLCRRFLEREGYEVLESGDGREALSAVARKSPDVIVMDVMMPEMDGLECTRRLRSNPDTRDIPIIMVSAQADEADITSGLQAGADEYLTKPIRASELIMRVNSMTRMARERTDLLRSYEFRGEQTRVLQCLLEYCRELAGGADVDTVMQTTLRVAAEVTSSLRSAIFIPDAQKQKLSVACSIGFEDKLADMNKIPIGETVPAHVFQTRQPVVVNNQEEADALSAPVDACSYSDPPYCCVPLGASERNVGVLLLTGRPGGRPFTPHDLECLDLLGNVAGSAICAETNRKARDRACDSIVVALAKLAEHRDSDTGKHVDRVTRYCLILANELRDDSALGKEIDDAFLYDLERAVPLHDIGKVAIPDQILLKPGRLTDPEIDVMRSHADIGADTIESISRRTPDAPFLEMAVQIARGHHEWVDGNGYPRAVRGDAIPLAARIAALADVYDALTTKRVYKDAIPHDDAVRIITGLSGQQFDPRIVRAFQTRCDEFAQQAAELVDGPIALEESSLRYRSANSLALSTADAAM